MWRLLFNVSRSLSNVPPLTGGNHSRRGQGMCVMEAAAFVAGEAWTDHPVCVCPVIGAFLREWNDRLPNSERDDLMRPLIPLIINTRSTPVVERLRAMLAADWLVRTHTVAWLRLAGLAAQADALSALPKMTSAAESALFYRTLEAILNSMYRNRDDKISILPWDAIRQTAGSAAALASSNIVNLPAINVSFSAAKTVTWSTSDPLSAINATRLDLQQSALSLVHRMIAVNERSA